LGDCRDDRPFRLRPSASLTRIEYAALGLMATVPALAWPSGFGPAMALLILLLALRWRLQGQLLLPHRFRGQLKLADQPPRLICYACLFGDGEGAWPLASCRMYRSRYFLLIRRRHEALLLVADRFDSAAEHARFRRRLFELMENHAR